MWIEQELLLTLLEHGIALLYWGTPPVLAVAVMLNSAVDEIGVGSVLAVVGAVVTLSVVGLSIYTLINPPEGGGVFFGHIISSIAVIPFVIVVFLRRILNRLFARIWLHPEGLFSEGN
ncbi:hypothetical protein AArcSl_3023 [Halalkaliarchaeum desulfuricum]|uniref:Uncharacterized protein n=1 Tax=Halalkaliarchaeum desulfuricum TaxID=2055893 RepID=A0A343TNG2_9EURY|nr:hypothetical protein AArcSl_3023 [Halalkaliarchaeum desulfuricum]